MRDLALTLRRRLSDESGVTLVELMSVLLIMSVVMVFVLGTFGSLLWSTERTELRLQNLDEARLMLDTMTKDIRTATRKSTTESPFEVADARTMTFYANITRNVIPTPPVGPWKIRLYVNGSNQLAQDIQFPTADCSSPSSCTYGAAVTDIIGYYVTNAGAIFHYYDDTGTELTSTPLSATNLVQIDEVGITLTVRKQTNFQVPSVTLQNRVRMPNVDYNPLS